MSLPQDPRTSGESLSVLRRLVLAVQPQEPVRVKSTAAIAWSRDELRALRVAVRAHPASSYADLGERWRRIAQSAGLERRSARSCLDKAKQLRDADRARAAVDVHD